jgi:hypothetical protein
MQGTYIMKIQIFWNAVLSLWANRIKHGLCGTCGNTPLTDMQKLERFT